MQTGGYFGKYLPNDERPQDAASASCPHAGELAVVARFLDIPRENGNMEFYVNLPTFKIPATHFFFPKISKEEKKVNYFSSLDFVCSEGQRVERKMHSRC